MFQGCANLAKPDAPALRLTFAEPLRGALRRRSRDKGLIAGDTVEEQAADAQRIINEAGILPEQNLVQPSSGS